MRIAAFEGIERANGFGDVGGEGVDAELEFDEVGRRPGGGGGRPRPAKQGVNGNANPAGIGRNELNFLAIDLEGFIVDVGGDAAVVAGRDAGDFGEAEVRVAELGVLADEAIGMGAADAGVIFAEFLPGEAEVVEYFGIANLFEALSARGGATAGDDGEGLLEAGPGAEIDLFLRIHSRFSSGTFRDFGDDWLKRKQFAKNLRLVQIEPVQSGWNGAGPANLGSPRASHNLIVTPGCAAGGCGKGWKGA